MQYPTDPIDPIAAYPIDPIAASQRGAKTRATNYVNNIIFHFCIYLFSFLSLYI